MSTNVDEYEEQLEAEEKKHKKIIKYDVEIFVVLLVILVIVVIANLTLKSYYGSITDAKSGLAPVIVECNKGILNTAETFRKNSTDSQARASVDVGKIAFDGAISYFGRQVKKGTEDGVIVDVIDSCYKAAIRFRTVLVSQRNLGESGVSLPMLNDMDNDIKRLKGKIDSLVLGIESYNSAGFFLKFSWMTPYPGKIEYNHTPLPELQPYVEVPPTEKPK